MGGKERHLEETPAMTETLPALCLIAVPGRRRRTIELCQETEKRGYAGIYTPSPFGNMSTCEALSWNTASIPFGTAIAPIYQRTVMDFAQSAAMMHEISNERFRLGIGIAHGPSHVRMGVTPGKPLADTRSFIEKFRAQEGLGPLPPIIVAALRKKMVALAGELAEGVIFANASLSHMGQSLAALPAARRNDPAFFIGNMIPTCISDDVEAAKAVHRRTLTNYAFLPNYRNYWKEAGYLEEMEGIEKAIAEGRRDDVPKYLSDKWLADNTLFGPAAKVREGVAAWRAAGVHAPILVPSSAAGNQMKAIEEVFATFG
jgi:alkanesulfonate monooxygenase SsuD/methylene tetrahydromethanopterin reductase-like flavin-dependent oxidoreductase (luciferase family)